MFKIYLNTFSAYNNDNEAKTAQPNCNDKMRMEIKVHPKRHHSHIKHTNIPTTTTVDRKSPKFVDTKPSKLHPKTKETTTRAVNQAGMFKGEFC